MPCFVPKDAENRRRDGDGFSGADDPKTISGASMTGAELAAARKREGLTQSELAKRAGIGRHAVSYWENKDSLDPRDWAVGRMLGALGLEPVSHFYIPNAHARGWGVTAHAPLQARLDALVEAKMGPLLARQAQRAAQRRVLCGAITRKCQPCRNLSEPGKRRCKFHGGKSTGPKTAERRARIAEAQRRRWAKWRAGSLVYSQTANMLIYIGCPGANRLRHSRSG